jgi:hypothetical protein
VSPFSYTVLSEKLELLQLLVQICEVEFVKYKNTEHTSLCRYVWDAPRYHLNLLLEVDLNLWRSISWRWTWPGHDGEDGYGGRR